MSLVKRTISGILKTSASIPIAGGTIKVRPVGVFGESGVLVARNVIKAETAINGAYSFDLLVSNTVGAFVRYECALPDEAPISVFTFDLINGPSTSLDALM